MYKAILTLPVLALTTLSLAGCGSSSTTATSSAPAVRAVASPTTLSMPAFDFEHDIQIGPENQQVIADSSLADTLQLGQDACGEFENGDSPREVSNNALAVVSDAPSAGLQLTQSDLYIITSIATTDLCPAYQAQWGTFIGN